MAEALLDHPADPNVMSLGYHGTTPLVMAVRSKDKAMTALLLRKAKNLDLGQRTLKGVPFGAVACDFATGEIRQMLKAHGALPSGLFSDPPPSEADVLAGADGFVEPEEPPPQPVLVATSSPDAAPPSLPTASPPPSAMHPSSSPYQGTPPTDGAMGTSKDGGCVGGCFAFFLQQREGARLGGQGGGTATATQSPQPLKEEKYGAIYASYLGDDAIAGA